MAFFVTYLHGLTKQDLYCLQAITPLATLIRFFP